MLSSDFTQEMGALIRSLEQKVRLEPALAASQIPSIEGSLDHIERAIVSLVALHIALRQTNG